MSAAFGVGGAVISTPAIRALGASAFVAVGSTLPSIFPSAASGTLRYAREGMILWRVAAWTGAAGIAAAVGGSLLSHAVPGDGHWLMILTATLIGVTAARMARAPARAPVSSGAGPSRAGDPEAEGAADIAIHPDPPHSARRRRD